MTKILDKKQPVTPRRSTRRKIPKIRNEEDNIESIGHKWEAAELKRFFKGFYKKNN